MAMPQFQQVQLFVDASEEIDNSHAIINFLDKNIKIINSNKLLINIVAIVSDKDKKLLLENNIDKLPTMVYNDSSITGLKNILGFIQSKRTPRKKKTKTEAEMLRDAQMEDMNMDKYDNGDYDDEGEEDEDGELRGDPDAVKQHLQRRMAEFQQRRKGRTEDDGPVTGRGKKKKGRRKKKHRVEDIDMFEDNIAAAPRNVRPKAGGNNGGIEINPEEWDIETQQLLDKGGFD